MNLRNLNIGPLNDPRHAFGCASVTFGLPHWSWATAQRIAYYQHLLTPARCYGIIATRFCWITWVKATTTHNTKPACTHPANIAGKRPTKRKSARAFRLRSCCELAGFNRLPSPISREIPRFCWPALLHQPTHGDTRRIPAACYVYYWSWLYGYQSQELLYACLAFSSDFPYPRWALKALLLLLRHISNSHATQAWTHGPVCSESLRDRRNNLMPVTSPTEATVPSSSVNFVFLIPLAARMPTRQNLEPNSVADAMLQSSCGVDNPPNVVIPTDCACPED